MQNEEDALLPTGLRDILPNDAALEAETVEKIVTFFGHNGFDRVKAPLIEFEDGLLSGAGVALAPDTFRLMDPVSQRMMGVRADITPQIARIARTRLTNSTRPLRLSYSGEVLRVRGTQLRPERQVLQVGAELIGSGSTAADVEIIFLAADAISSVGSDDFSVDLTVPRLVPSILEKFEFSEDVCLALRVGLDRKDPEVIRKTAGPATEILTALLESTGPVENVLPRLKKLTLPHIAGAELLRLEEVVSLLRDEAPKFPLTLDPVENRGFEYHTGIGFTIFARGTSGELARGGRFRVKGADRQDSGEKATGVTLYIDTILDMIDKSRDKPRIMVSIKTSRKVKSDLHNNGWVTISALEDEVDLCEEAIRLECSHYMGKSGPKPTKG